MAAPMATTSSGLTPLCGSLPKKLLHRLPDLRHAGHAADQNHFVDLAACRPASLSAALHGSMVRLTRSSTRLSSLARRQLQVRCFGTGLVGGDEGQVDLGLVEDDSSILAFLGSFLEPLQRQLVVAQVDALVLLELVGEIVDERMSKSSPPRKVSPLVDFTSNTPSPISRIETSNVPPPRS
jgi:hypothetical protein